MGLHGDSGSYAASSVNRNDVSGQVGGHVVQVGAVKGDLHVHGSVRQRLPIPRQLPPVSANFIGREQDLVALDAVYQDGLARNSTTIIVISGTAGVGKSSLAKRFLHGLGDRFGGGQLYADLHGFDLLEPVTPAEQLGRFLLLLGVDADSIPDGLAERAALFRSVTAAAPVALLLENAISAAQVRVMLPSSAGSLTIVTTRNALTGLIAEGAHIYRLGLLQPEASMALLARSVGSSRVENEPEAAREVVERCAHLPLAVCVAAAKLAARPRWPLARMADALAAEHGRLAVLAFDGDLAVHAALDDSYRSLPEAVADMYRFLGCCPLPWFDAYVAAAAAGAPVDDAADRLEFLVDASLVEELDQGRHRFHDLVRLAAAGTAERQDGEEGRTAVVRRVLDFYVSASTIAEQLLTPSHARFPRSYAGPPWPLPRFGDERTALEWLVAHRDNLMALLRHADANQQSESAWQLVDAMWPLFLRRRFYDDWIEAHRIGLRAARALGDRQAEGRMLTSGGNGLRGAGRLAEAIDWYEQASRLYGRTGDRRGQAQSRNALGLAYRQLGRLTEARAHHLAALESRSAIGDRRGVALSHYGLGDVELAARRLPEARDHLERALDGLRAVDDAYNAARAQAMLGWVRAMLGHPGEALDDLLTAREAFERAGSRHWEARTLEMTGQVQLDMGDETSGRASLAESLAAYESISESDAERVRARLAAASDRPPE